MAESDFDLYAKLGLDSSGFTSEIKKSIGYLSDFQGTLGKATDSVSNGLKSWGVDLNQFYDKGSSIFKNFGVDIDKFASHFGMSGALMSGITAVTAALNKLGEAVNQATAEIVKGTGKIGSELRSLETTAKDAMINGVGGSAQEVGQIIANLNTRFGVTGQKAVEMTDSFDQLSHVMGVSASNAVNSVADAIKKWGKSTSDTIPLLDQLTVASQESGASFDSLLSGITSGQSIFSQFGMSLTDSIAFLGALSAEGIGTESAMTGLRTALAKFAAGGEDASLGLARVSKEIKNATSQTEAMRIATETFGTRAGAEMVRVLQSESSAAEDLCKKLDEATGALARTDEASRTASAAWKDLKQALQGVFGDFGQGINDMLRDLIDSIRNFVDLISPIIRPVGETFRTIFSTIGYVVKTASGDLLDFFNSETDVEKITAEANKTLEKQASKVSALTEEIRKLDTATRNMRKASLTSSMLAEKGVIENTRQEIERLTKEIEDYEKKVAESKAKQAPYAGSVVNNGSFIDMAVFTDAMTAGGDALNDFWQEGTHIADVREELSKLSAELKLHEAIYESLNSQIQAFSDVEQDEAKARSQAEQDEADKKAKAQKEALEKLSEYSKKFTDMEYQQSLEQLKNEMANEVQRAENAGKTQEEIFAIKQDYLTQIKEKLKEQIDAEEQAELDKLKAIEDVVGKTDELEALRTKITNYYTNERKALEVEAVQAVSDEWQSAFDKMATNSASYADKLLAQQIRMKKLEMQDALTRAENEGKTDEEILSIRRGFEDEINTMLEQQINNERNAELAKVAEMKKTLDETEQIKALEKQINDYYDNEIASLKMGNLEKITKKIEEQQQLSYTWDLKLLNLEKDRATTEEERKDKQKQILEIEKAQALATAKTPEEIKKINDYYKILLDDLDAVNDAKTADYTWTQKLQQQELSRLQTSMDSAVEVAKSEGKSEEEIAKIKEKYLNQIKDKQLEQLELQKEIDLARSSSAEQTAEIEKYYTNEKVKIEEEAAKKISGIYIDETKEKEKQLKAIADMQQEWDNKLSQQKLNRLKTEKQYEIQMLEEQGVSDEEILAKKKELASWEAENDAEKLEREREAALAIAKSKEEEKLINKYYDDEKVQLEENLYQKLLSLQQEYDKSVLAEKEKQAKRIIEWDEKIADQNQNAIKADMERRIEQLEAEGASDDEILAKKKIYLTTKLNMQLSELEKEKQAEIEKVKDTENAEEEIARINNYYQNQELIMTQETADEINKVVSDREKAKADGIKSWGDKLASQQKELLESEEETIIARLEAEEASDEEILTKRKEFLAKKYELTLEEIEQERETALASAKSYEERESIQTYYDNRSLLATEQYNLDLSKLNEKGATSFSSYVAVAVAAVKKMKDVFQKIGSTIKNITSGIFNAIKTVGDGIKSFVAGIESGINGLFDSFVSIVSINIDESLDKLLEFEDKILVFFDESVPRFPEFVAAAIESVNHLFGSLQTLDWSEVFGHIGETLDVIIEEAPNLISDFFQTIERIGSSLFGMLDGLNWGNIFGNIGSFLRGIIDEMPDKLSDFFGNVNSLAENAFEGMESVDWNEVFGKLPDVLTTILTNIPTYTSAFFVSVGTLVRNGFELIDQIDWSSVFGSVGASLENILKDLPETLSSFFKAANNLIKSASKAVQKIDWKGIFSGFSDMTNEFLEGLPDALSSIWDSVFAVIEGLFDSDFLDDLLTGVINMITNLIGKLPDAITDIVGLSLKLTNAVLAMLPSLITALGELAVEIVKKLPDIIDSIINGLVDFLTNLDAESIGDIIESIITVVGELATALITNAPRIVVSLATALPRLVGAWFETMPTVLAEALEGAWNGAIAIFASVGEWASGVWDDIKNAFTDPKGFATDVWNGIKEGFKNVGQWFTNLWQGVKDSFVSIFSGIGDFVKNIFGGDDTSSYSDVYTKEMKDKVGKAIQELRTEGFSEDEIYNWLNSRGLAAYAPVAEFRGYAVGTESAMRGLAIVGESGPELVRFRGGEQVLNARNTQKALQGMNGTTINQSVTFNNLADTTAYAMMNQLRQYNRQLAINGVF
ncbi:MAG: phage tail tape measure protein [Treponemataceae bacterium]|nr:phage tail tape measure protein [Treponemataceae bacterium]